jgi:hypothetical protein
VLEVEWKRQYESFYPWLSTPLRLLCVLCVSVVSFESFYPWFSTPLRSFFVVHRVMPEVP